MIKSPTYILGYNQALKDARRLIKEWYGTQDNVSKILDKIKELEIK